LLPLLQLVLPQVLLLRFSPLQVWLLPFLLQQASQQQVWQRWFWPPV
jgi:hypothetical protein